QDPSQGRRGQRATRQRRGFIGDRMHEGHKGEQRAQRDGLMSHNIPARSFSLRVLCLLCVFGATPGCVCALAGRGSFLPDYIRTIGIPIFLNRTTVFNLETMLTEKVRAEFIGRGKYQPLPESAGVDALLTGEVANVAIVPSSYNTQQLATRYSIIMTARIELKDMKTNKVLWENAGVTFREEYDATGGTSVIDPA